MMHRSTLKTQSGAALLLLVAVLGLGAASLLMHAFSRNGAESQRQQRTLAILAQARDALTGFAATNGRLPRPATSAIDGRERPAECASDADCSGFLPWVALGVPGLDAWGKVVRYSVTPEMASAPIASVSAVANRVILQRKANGGLAYLIGQEQCDVSAQCLPAVVFSQGKEGYGTAASGTRLTPTLRGNVDEAANELASTSFVTGNSVDDLLAWITLPALYQRMRAARTLP